MSLQKATEENPVRDFSEGRGNRGSVPYTGASLWAVWAELMFLEMGRQRRCCCCCSLAKYGAPFQKRPLHLLNDTMNRICEYSIL